VGAEPGHRGVREQRACGAITTKNSSAVDELGAVRGHDIGRRRGRSIISRQIEFNAIF
jgi:hypothetical protein